MTASAGCAAMRSPACARGTKAAARALVGDIINGTPQFVDSRSAGFQLLRSAFSPGLLRLLGRHGRATRSIAGADQCGHVARFQRHTGAELFAYVPSEVLSPVSGQDFAPLRHSSPIRSTSIVSWSMARRQSPMSCLTVTGQRLRWAPWAWVDGRSSHWISPIRRPWSRMTCSGSSQTPIWATASPTCRSFPWRTTVRGSVRQRLQQ